MLTSKQIRRTQRKHSISAALAGAAATAFVQAFKPPSVPPSPSKSKSVPPHQLSPNNKANLRRKCLEDLHSLNQLLNDGVLTADEFQEQKFSWSAKSKIEFN